MRIGIDLTWMGDRPAGMGTMAREVVDELQRREGLDVVLFEGQMGHLALRRAIKRAQLDLYWQVGGWLPLLMPRGVKTIQTVHDMMAFDHPEWFPQSGLSRWWSLNVRVRRAIRRATIVHSVSEWTAERILAHLPDVSDKIVVVHEGVEGADVGRAELPANVKKPFVLMVGTIEPRKNINAGVKAIGHVNRVIPSVQLVIAGKVGWMADAPLGAMKAPNVVHLEYVYRDVLWGLIRNAEALLMPSFEEGFGRPLVEAMSVGTPVIACYGSAMEEVVGKAGTLCRPHETKKIAKAILKLMNDGEFRDEMSYAGERRAMWFRVPKMIDSILEEAL